MLLDGADDKEPVDIAPADDKEPAAPEIPPPPEPDKPVALAGPPKSRRQRIDEEYTTTVKDLKGGMEELRRSLAERDQRLGELTGHMAALSQRAYQPQPQYQAPQPQLPDPEEMERKALERLDARDMAGYHRFLGEANTARTLRTLAPVLAQRQQQQYAPPQEQVPPGLMPFYAAYPDVASHPNQMRLLAAENERLEAMGVARGPERVKQIFENIRATLSAGRPAGSPAFSQSSAAALSGVPTTRPVNGGSGGGGPRVDLTQEERVIAKRAGMSDAKMAELVMKNDPGRVIRG